MIYLFKVIRLKKIIKFILIILCMLLIFSFSSDTATESSKKSDGTIVKVSEMLIGRKLTTKEKKYLVGTYTVIVRKSAHFILYFILGLLIYSFLLEYSFTNKQIIMITITIVLLYSISDEVHQMFIKGRSGEVRDVFIDTIAGSLACFSYYILRRKLNGQEKTIS